MRLCRWRSRGKATAPAAIAAMRPAMIRNVFMNYLGFRRRFIVQRHARTAADDAIGDDAAEQQHDERSAPDEQRLRFQRRAEAHELAVTVRHELENGAIAL